MCGVGNLCSGTREGRGRSKHLQALWTTLALSYLEGENVRVSAHQLPWEETDHGKLVASAVPQGGSGHSRGNCM